MRTQPPLAIAVLLLASPLFAQTPATQNGPEPLPDFAAETGPRAAFYKFIDAVLAGDAPAAKALVYFADDSARPQYIFHVESIIADAHLRQAAIQALGDEGKKLDIGMNPEDILQTKIDAARGQVKTAGDSATITTKGGNVYTLIQKNGRWLIDWNPTAKVAFGDELPPERQVNAITLHITAENALSDQVAAKKFATAAEIETAYNKMRADANQAAATQDAATQDAAPPATRPQ